MRHFRNRRRNLLLSSHSCSLRKTSKVFPHSFKPNNIPEWAGFRVAQLLCSQVGIRHHYQLLKEKGESERRLNLLSEWQECGLFTEKERLALALAEALTFDPSSTASRGLLEYSRHYFSAPEFVPLVITILAVNDWNDMDQCWFENG